MAEISMRRAKAVNEYFLENGERAAVQYYGVTTETIHRYLRIANNEKTNRHPKILLFDLETLPLVAYTWGLYKQNLNYDNIIKDWCCLSWSGKWLYSSEVMGEVLTTEEARKRDDKRIMTSLWDLFDQADILIAHNLLKFDNKRAKTRFILNGLTPPSPYQTIDTLRIAREQFSFASNRLDYLGQLMVRKGKIETNYGLWKRCDNGEQEALDYMLEYNKEDVNLLEEVYLEIRAWMKSHPNLAIYSEAQDECCPVCGGSNLEEKGMYCTNVSAFESLRCRDCGAPSRRRKSVLTKTEKDNLLVSNAR